MKRLCWAGLALVLLCGCSANAREPDRLALVRVLGVDGASPVTLTAVCADGGRAAVAGETFSLARYRLPWAGEEELALTNVSWLAVGRDVDLTAALYAILEERELGASMTVWLADEGAAALLENCTDPAADLELLKKQGVQAPTAAKTLGMLRTEGSVLLPVVTAREGRLTLRGEERWNEQ